MLPDVVLAGDDGAVPLRNIVIAVELEQALISRLTIFIVVQNAVLVHNTLEHLAVSTELIVILGQISGCIQLPDIVLFVDDERTVPLCNIVVAMILEQALIRRLAVLIIVQLAVLFNNTANAAVLADLSTQESTLSIKVIMALRQLCSCVQLPDIVSLADDQRAVILSTVVVVTNLEQALIGRFAVFNVVQLAVLFNKVSQRTAASTILAKVIPHSLDNIVHLGNFLFAGNNKLVTEVVHIVTDLIPASTDIIGTIVVTVAIEHIHPDAGDQLAVLLEFKMNMLDGQLTGGSCHGGAFKVVPLTVDALPAGGQNTNVGVAVNLCSLVVEQTGELALTNVDAVLAEVIVDVVDLLDTGQSLAIYIVSEAADLVDPAFLHSIHQSVFIGDLCVGITEVTACVRGISRITVGIHAKHRLAFRLLREAIQTAGTHVDLIADVAGVYCVDLGSISPYAVLGGQLDAIDDAQGICGCSIDHLALLDPVQGHSQGVGGLVEFNALHLKVIIENLQVAVINHKTVIEVDGCLNPGQVADTLCQTGQEGPCIGALHGATGQHIGQLFQTLRDGNCGHIHSEDVGSDHVIRRINNVVDVAIFNHGVGNLTIPSQLTVAAAGLLKVEAVLALLIQHDVNVCTDAIADRSSDRQSLDRGFCSHEGKAIDGTCSRCTQSEGHIVGVNGNSLTLKTGTQGQVHTGTVNCVYLSLFKVQLIGVGDGHELAADDLAVQHQINSDLTHTLAGKYTISSDGAPAFIADSPGSALRNIHGIAAGADAGSSHLHRSIDSCVIVLALDHSMVKLGGAGSGGVQQQVGGNITGIAVGGTVHDGQLIATGLTCNEGSGAAAVQVDSNHTAGFLHDVAHILQACTGGEGSLTTVNTHNDHTTGRGNTNRGTGSIAVGSTANDLAVLHNEFTEAADCFLNLALHGLVLIISTHVSSTVIQDRKEASGVGLGIPFHTVHHNQAAGSSIILHTVATGVGGSDNIEVFDVVSAVGIAVAVLSILGGAGNRIVLPHRVLGSTGITVIIVDPHTNIVTVHVSSCDIEDDLLAISVGCIADLLGDAGSQNLGLGIEHGEAGVGQVFHIVTGNTAHLVCKGVADSLTQLSQLAAGSVKVTGAFQGSDQLVAGVSIVHGSTQILTGAQAIQTVGQQVADTGLQGQAGLVELSQHLSQITGLITLGDQLIHDVISIQVSEQVTGTKGAGRTGDIGLEQILILNVLNLLFQRKICRYTILVSGAQQVGQVTNPAANVSMVLAALVVVGHIHGAEEVTAHAYDILVFVQISLIGGADIGLELLQAGNIDPHFDRRIGVDGIFHFLDVLQEVLILSTCHDGPGAGGIVFHTGTHIVQHQAQRIRARVIHSVLSSHHFQIADIGQEFLQSLAALDLNLGNLNIALGVVAAELTGSIFILLSGLGSLTQQAVVMSIPANSTVGCLLGITVHPSMGQCRDGICIVITNQAVTGAVLMADGVTGCRNLHIRNEPAMVRHRNLSLCNQNLAAVATVRALCQTGFGTACGNSSIYNDQMLLLGLKVQIAASTCRGIALAGIGSVPVMPQCRDHFLGNPEFVTLLTLPAGGHAVLSTGSGNFLSNGNTEMLLANNNQLCLGTQRTLITHIGCGVTAVVLEGRTLIPNVTVGVDGQALFLGLLAAIVQAGVDQLALGLTGSLDLIGIFRPVVVIGINGSCHRCQRLGSSFISEVGFAVMAVPVANNTHVLAGSSNGFNLDQHTMSLGRDLCVGGVATVGAGHIGIPADLSAGGILCLVGDFAMRHDCLLHIGGVVAARAGHISVPADLSTGGSLRSVGHFVMAQCSDDPAILLDLVLTGSVTVVVLAGRAVPVSAVTGIGTGSSLSLSAGHGVGVRTGQNGNLSVFIALFVAGGAFLMLDTCLQDSGFLVGDPLPAMTQSGNFHLDHNDGGTDGAVLALGQTGFGTGGSNSLVDDLSVTQGSNTLLSNQDLSADGAVLALGSTHQGTGGGDSLINDLGVAQCVNGFLSNQNFTADGAVLALGQAGSGTGRSNSLVDSLGVAQSVNGFLSDQDFTTDGAVLTLGQTGSSTGRSNSCVNDLGVTQRSSLGIDIGTVTAILTGMSGVADSSTARCSHHGIVLVRQNSNLFRVGIVATVTGNGLDASFQTGSSLGYFLTESTGFICMGASPDSIDGLVSHQTGVVCGFSKGTVRIRQLGRGDRNLKPFISLVIRPCILDLVSHSIRTGLHDDGAGTTDLSTTGSGVDVALRQIGNAVDFHVGIVGSALNGGGRCGILQVDMGGVRRTTERGAFTCLKGTCCDPLIVVIDKDLVAATQSTGCVLADDQSCTGKQCNILGHRHGAAVHSNGHITINGQGVLAGIDGLGAKHTQLHRQAQALNAHITICIDQQATGGLIVILNDVAVGDVEHTIRANEGNLRALNAEHRDLHGHITLFDGTGLQGHRNFDVLDVVLGHGEHTLGIINQTRGVIAATPVHYLEALIDRCTALHGDGTCALNVAPGIQLTAIVNGNIAAGLHLNKAAGTDGRALTATGFLSGRKADRTVDHNIGTGGHGQGTVSSGSCEGRGFRGGRFFRAQGIGIIIRNQHSDAAGDGVVTGRQRTVVHQHDSLAAGCLLNCFIQVTVDLTAINQEVSVAAGHQSLDGGISSRIDRVPGRFGQDLVILVHPAQEAAAGGSQSHTVSCRHIRNGHSGGAVGFHSGAFHRSGDRAVGGGIFNRNIKALVRTNQGHIGHNQLVLGRIGAGCNDDTKGLIGSQTLCKGAQSSQAFVSFCAGGIT